MPETTAPEATEIERVPGTVGVVIDGRAFTAHEGELVIEAVQRAGTYIPRFCYHPRMKPVGMCRMCLVEVSGPRGASLQPACFVAVSEGQEISTHSLPAQKAQEAMLEFLLVNHPLDCPICDKGGECPLQDQAMSYGPGETRFEEEKRHWAKPIEIGPLTLLDRERCIQCARCTRFAEEIAGEPLIDFSGRGDRIEVSIFPSEPFTSYFSGNTVQICPVGALTSVPYRFKSRPWDLEQVETTCTYCSVGCRVAVQSSAGTLVRYLGIDSDPINQSWLCDRGRYGFEATSAKERLTEPLLREEGELCPTTWREALRLVADGLLHAMEGSAATVGIIGGARLTNEGAYAWSKLARAVIGTDNIDAQLADGLPAELVLGLPRATLDEACSAKAVVVIAGDLREEVPVLHLRLRSAAANQGLRIIECSPVPTGLSPEATVSIRHLPGEAPALARSLAGLEGGAGGQQSASEAVEKARRLLEEVLGDGAEGEGIVVVIGRPSVGESAAATAAAAATLHQAWPAARFLPALRRSNVFGALDMGLAPGVLPGRVRLDEGRAWFTQHWASLPAAEGLGTASMLEAVAAGEIRVLVLLGADPLSDFPDRELVTRALEAVELLVSVDALPNASALLADVVLPAAGPDERDGTTTSLEGRVTLLGRKLVPPGLSRSDWVIAAELAGLLGSDLGFDSAEEIWREIEKVAPAHAGCTLAALRRAGGDGLVVPLAATAVGASGIGTRSNGSAPGRPRLIDPMATPGIASVREQGAPFDAGATVDDAPDGDGSAGDPDDETVVGSATDPPPASVLPTPDSPASSSAVERPSLISVREGEFPVPPPTPVDGYALRLVTTRSLYDRGSLVQAAPSLAALVPPQQLRLAPKEIDKLGIASGDEIRVTSAAGELIVSAIPDATVPVGIAVLPIGVVPVDEASPTSLIDISSAVVKVRLETLS